MQPWDRACEDCLPKIRKMARLVPEFDRAQALSYLSTRVPIMTVALLGLAILFTALAGRATIGPLSPSTFVGIGALFTGVQIMWNRLENRYGAVHDLKWSLNSKPVVRGLVVVIAGLIVSSLAVYIHI